MTERGKHTKWMYELHLPKGSADGVWQVLDAEQVIANVDPNDAYTDEAENFARLIAAAPILLEALRVMVDHAQEQYPHFESERGQRDIQAAIAAIKAAEKGE